MRNPSARGGQAREHYARMAPFQLPNRKSGQPTQKDRETTWWRPGTFDRDHLSNGFRVPPSQRLSPDTVPATTAARGPSPQRAVAGRLAAAAPLVSTVTHPDGSTTRVEQTQSIISSDPFAQPQQLPEAKATMQQAQAAGGAAMELDTSATPELDVLIQQTHHGQPQSQPQGTTPAGPTAATTVGFKAAPAAAGADPKAAPHATAAAAAAAAATP